MNETQQQPLNFEPYPPNQFKPGSQNYRVYERLKRGPVTNIEIVRQMFVLNSTGRISEVREYLKNYAMDVKAKPLPEKGKGQWEYRIAG